MARVVQLMNTPPISTASSVLLVDYGGVGRGIYDMLHVAGLRRHTVAIQIHGGKDVNRIIGGYSVPKRDLIVATQTRLQSGQLQIASGLEHAPTLVKEFQDYRVKISDAGHDSYDAREGQHDDLVLAVAMCCWHRDHYWKSYDEARVRRRGLAAVPGPAGQSTGNHWRAW